jgi:protoheme IX farnesyltransferase
LLLYTLVGTAMVVASGNMLNQVMERDVDALMRRTRNRPLPAGRMEPAEAVVSGVSMAALGLLCLAVAVNPLTALLTFIGWANYVFLYTPLKRKTSVATLVGAISGALPPLIGWVAVRNSISAESLALPLILFLWQLPHFLAIAWMYQEDYGRAGFPMLPVTDPGGTRAGQQIVAYGLALVPASLLPTLFGITGMVYFAGALVLSLIFLGYGVRTAVRKSRVCAKHLLFVSLVYLTALVVLMVVDKRMPGSL